MVRMYIYMRSEQSVLREAMVSKKPLKEEERNRENLVLNNKNNLKIFTLT